MLTKRPDLTVDEWLASVPADRKSAIDVVRAAVNEHLPHGYEETVDWGMLAWVVPLTTLPNTHNGRPLMLAALGAHRKLMTIYLMSVYGDPKIRKEFQAAYKKSGKRLNMGGSCVHFKTLDDLPIDVIGEAITRVTVDDYVERYIQSRSKGSAKKKPAKAKAKKPTKGKR